MHPVLEDFWPDARMGKGARGIFNAHPAWVDVVVGWCLVAGRDDADG